MRKRSIILGLFLLSSLALAATLQEPATLRLKLESGKAVKYQHHTAIAQEMGGMDLSQSLDMTMNLVGTKVEKGTQVVIGMSDAKVTVPENMPMQGTPEDLAKAINSVKVTSTFNEYGKSSDVKVEGDSSAKTLMGAAANMNMGFLGLQYPEQALKIGDTWKVDFDLSSVIAAASGSTDTTKKVIIPVTYTLTKLENGVATIEAKEKGKFDVDTPQGITVTVNTDTTSTYVIDVATGLPNTIDVKGHNVVDTPMGPLDQNVTSTTKKL